MLPAAKMDEMRIRTSQLHVWHAAVIANHLHLRLRLRRKRKDRLHHHHRTEARYPHLQSWLTDWTTEPPLAKQDEDCWLPSR